MALNTSTSVVDFLKLQNKPSDFNSRLALYESSGLKDAFGDYRGTAEQNSTLLQKLSATQQQAPAAPLPPLPSGGLTEKDIIDQTGPGTVSNINDLDQPEESVEEKQARIEAEGQLARGGEGLTRGVAGLQAGAEATISGLAKKGTQIQEQIGEQAAGFGGAFSGKTKKSQAEVAQEVAEKQALTRQKLGDDIYNLFSKEEQALGTEFLSRLSIPEAQEFASKIPAPIRGVVMNTYQQAVEKAQEKAQKSAADTLEKLGYVVVGGKLVSTLAGRTAERADEAAVRAERTAERQDAMLEISERRLQLAERAAQNALTTNNLTPRQNATFLRISDNFQKDSVIKSAGAAVNARTIADQVIANPGSAGNQLKILYTLVKSLDPDTAVREGELSLVQSTQSYIGRWETTLEKLSTGKLVDNKTALELAKATKELADMWDASAKRRTVFYNSQAKTGGIGKAWGEYTGGIEAGMAELDAGGGGGADGGNNNPLGI